MGIHRGFLKRFTETNKWRDPWFRRLSGSAKLLWYYVIDNCDAVGLIELDIDLASADCQQTIKQQHLDELGTRVQPLGDNRYFIPKFIHFQYGELSPNCPAHKPVLKMVQDRRLERLGLLYRYPTIYPTATLAIGYKNGKEEERKTGNGSPEGKGPASQSDPPSDSGGFGQFWAEYPRKVAKADAVKAFERHKLQTILPAVLKALEEQKASLDWTKEGGRFIPYPATWINAGRWEDDVNSLNFGPQRPTQPIYDQSQRL